MDTDETPSAAAEPVAPANSRAAWIVAGVMTAVALVAAMVAVSAVMRDDDGDIPAGLQRAAFSRPVAGEITSIDGTSFKVKENAPNGETATTTVETNKDTTFRQSVQGSLSDLAVGDTISATGATTDNVLTATRITETAVQANVVRRGPMVFSGEAPAGGVQVGPSDGPRMFTGSAGNMRVGEITKIEGDTITLAGLDGAAVTVKTTPGTEIRINKTIALRNLKVGDTVRVLGPMSGDKVVANEVTKGALDDDLAA